MSTDPMRWSEAGIIQALARAFEWHRRVCCPNVQEGSEMDFVMLTESGYLWECEVKISMADWRADQLKRRHYGPGWAPARFYYAVPESLLAKGIPEWVPAHAGILALYEMEAGFPRVSWKRQAKVQHRAKAGDAVKTAMLRKVYFRYWRHVAPVIGREAAPTIEVPV